MHELPQVWPFSSLCYKKNGCERSLEQRSSKAHQLRIDSVCKKYSLCSKSEDYTSGDDSICFQLHVQLQSTQVENKFPAPQCLVTYLAT